MTIWPKLRGHKLFYNRLIANALAIFDADPASNADSIAFPMELAVLFRTVDSGHTASLLSKHNKKARA